MGYPKDYPLELDRAEHYVFESEDLEEQDIIPIGTTVRSYDFVVGNHILNDDSYFEGIIERFEPIPNCAPDCNHYIIRTTKIVRNGKEEEIVVGRNDYFSTHWNNYGVLPLGGSVDYEDSGDEPEYNWEYDAESYRPPVTAVKAAKKGLSQRKKWGRGGLSPAEAKSQGIDSGVTRARKISSGKVSRHDVRRMSAFNRHRKNNNPSKKMPDGGPTAGTIAWNLWGGTSGVNWAKKKSSAMNAETFEAELDGIELPVCCGVGMELFPYDGDIIITCQGYTQYFGITSRKHHCGQSKRLSQLQDGVLWEDCRYCGGELWDDEDLTFKTTDGLVCLKCYDEHYKEDEEFDTESEDTSGVRCNRCRQGFLQDIPRYEMVNNKPVECDNCRARFEVVSQGTASKLKTTSRRNKYFHAETFDAERGCSYPCPDCGTQMFQHNSNTGFGSYCSCWKCGSNYITKPIDAEMEGRDYQ
tara:strand:+ start:534 stop:1940 length:1407 start_codon:yes stop_codon:yes gene_type:complete